MKLFEVIATICGGAVLALILAGCGASDTSFAPGLPRFFSSGLPETCSEPAAYKPGSACAKDLAAAQTDPNFRIRDNSDTRVYLDNACADDAAWQPGSTCHLLTDVLQRAAVSPPAISFQPSGSTPMPFNVQPSGSTPMPLRPNSPLSPRP